MRGAIIAVALSLTAPFAQAWTEIALPPLTGNFVSYRTAFLPDGRFLYGTGSSLSREDAFGGSSRSDYANPQAWDPSFAALFSNSLGVIGVGGFSGPSQIHTFDPSDLNTAFTPIPALSIQNYSGLFHDGSSLLVGGGNGTGGSHSVNYVTLDGTTNKVIIDNISMFSSDFARDSSGNLYVSDNDDLKLYKFTAQQISDAIIGMSALSITDGVLVTTLNKAGSIAIDSQGRIWSAGFQSHGLDLFDSAAGTTTSFVPGFVNTNYVVSTFTDGSTAYVGYLNANGFLTGDALNFGYESDATLVPEPSGSLLFVTGQMLLTTRRFRGRKSICPP